MIALPGIREETYQLTFERIVDTLAESGLVFRTLYPRREVKLYLIWNRYQAFTPIAERFLAQFRGRRKEQ